MNNFTSMKDREFKNKREFIGASDVATLAKANDYQTPYEFWKVFTGREAGFSGNKKTRAGHLMEPLILGQYIHDEAIKADANGNMVMNEFITSRMYGDTQYENYHSWTECHPEENGRFTAHADLLDLSYETPVIVQAKNTGMMAANQRKRNPYKGYAKEDYSQNGVPIGVYFQEQWEMYCYGIPEAYVAVMIDGWDWRLYGPIQYRKKDVEKLVVLADWMLWHVDKDKPPTPKSWPDVTDMFPDLEKNTKSTIDGQDEMDARKIMDQHARTADAIRVLKGKQLDREMALALFACEPDLGVMHNYLTASDGTQLASFYEKAGQRRISVSKLEKEQAELFRQIDELGYVSQDNSSRMIRLSGANAGSVDLWTLVTEQDGKKKKSRKKYQSSEKKGIADLLKTVGIIPTWERFSRK